MLAASGTLGACQECRFLGPASTRPDSLVAEPRELHFFTQGVLSTFTRENR